MGALRPEALASEAGMVGCLVENRKETQGEAGLKVDVSAQETWGRSAERLEL